MSFDACIKLCQHSKILTESLPLARHSVRCWGSSAVGVVEEKTQAHSGVTWLKCVMPNLDSISDLTAFPAFSRNVILINYFGIF